MTFRLAVLAAVVGTASSLHIPQQAQRQQRPSISPLKAIALPSTETTTANPISISKAPLDPQDEWIGKLDYAAFAKEVSALGKELREDTGEADVQHLTKIASWRDIGAAIGILTMGSTPNPLTIIALSIWTYASWTMVAHHTCHGGYNRVDAGKYNSRGFALGSVRKRFEDWLDWMYPEAWNIEHNRLHHYRLNEATDPDLVQRNVRFLREMDAPMFVKYGIVAFFAATWKWFYYAPNTFKELQFSKYRQEGKPLPENINPTDSVTVVSLFGPAGATESALREVIKPAEFLIKVVGPFFLTRFVLLPAPLLAIPGAFGHAIVNLLLADLVTNIHSFATIVTNHAGSDLYTFDDAVKPKSGSFYVRQVVGSANYATGTDLVDFSHGWLNYQVEHHVWPDFSMLQYQKGAPKLKAICKKHGVPYVQESVFTRLRKTVDVMVGKSTMRRFPTEYEPAKDKALNGVTWKSTNGAIDEE